MIEGTKGTEIGSWQVAVGRWPSTNLPISQSPCHWSVRSPQSSCHPVTPSPRHAISLSPCHLVILSPCHSRLRNVCAVANRTYSPRHAISLSPCHLVILSPCHSRLRNVCAVANCAYSPRHAISLSPCLPVSPSPCHLVTSSPHPRQVEHWPVYTGPGQAATGCRDHTRQAGARSAHQVGPHENLHVALLHAEASLTN
ncbi:MAG: hypothetical protein D6790_15230 [Caldilineae bacterium]|nr:MAG: hypothetical protein D6790_15230 [Caldilineae bacterium]